MNGYSKFIQIRIVDAETQEALSSEISPDLLEAIGRVVVDWAQAEWIVHFAAATFIGVKPDHAKILFPRISMKELTAAILMVADQRDTTGLLSADLKPLITKLLREERKRNETVHDLWWKELQKKDMFRSERTKRATSRSLSPSQINRRAERISKAAIELAVALFKSAVAALRPKSS